MASPQSVSPHNCHARDSWQRASRARFVARLLSVETISDMLSSKLTIILPLHDRCEQARRSPSNAARASKEWIRDASFQPRATMSRHRPAFNVRAGTAGICLSTRMSPRPPWASRAAVGRAKIWLLHTRFSWEGDGSVNRHHRSFHQQSSPVSHAQASDSIKAYPRDDASVQNTVSPRTRQKLLPITKSKARATRSSMRRL